MPRITNREAHLEALRSKSIQIADEQGSKSRFGLFSQAPSFAIGDTQFVKHFHPKNEMGKPETQLRNIFSGPCRQGKDKKGLFNQEQYITVGDKYMDEFQRHRQEELKEKQKVPKDFPVFKPQNKTEQIIKPSYTYQEQNDQSRGKPVVRKLDELGRPITQKWNMKNPVSVDNIYKHPGYMKDEYGRLRDQQVQARLDHHKAMGEAPPMRQMDHGNKTFSTDKQIYGTDVKFSNTVKEERKPSIYPHDNTFRYPNPSKQGYNKCFNRYQKYIDDPYPIVKRKPPVENKKEQFKLNAPLAKTKPSPSISLNRINMTRVSNSLHR